jgi:hypothetical protein
MSAGSRQARASRTLRYTGLKLAEFNGGRAKRTPFKEFRQPYFGSLQEDNNTFSCETRQAHFVGIDPRSLALAPLAFQYLTHRAPGLIDGDIRIRAGARIGVRNRNFPERSSPDHPRLLFLFPVGIEE